MLASYEYLGCRSGYAGTMSKLWAKSPLMTLTPLTSRLIVCIYCLGYFQASDCSVCVCIDVCETCLTSLRYMLLPGLSV